MLNGKKVEILMAVYNGQGYIREQIDSILNQTHKEIHLVIRDNCSNDNTKEIVKEYQAKFPQRITLLTSPCNVGIIGNFAALLEHAQAGYVMFSDHDDVWLPNKIAKTLEKMTALENEFGADTPLLAHTDLKVVDKRLETIHPSFWHYAKLNPRMSTLSRQLTQNQITGCTMMINRPLLEIARPLPQNIVMHDWWLGICAAAFGRIGFVDESMMLYRQHGNNDTGAKKFSLRTIIKRMLNQSSREKIYQTRKMIVEQAKALLTQHENLLDESQKQLVKAFIKMEQTTLFSKAYLMVLYRFYHVGFLRNFLTIFRPKNL